MKGWLLLSLYLGLAFGCVPAASEETPTDHSTSISPSDTIPLPTNGFDFPVGPPDSKGYYNAQIFGKNNHLGDDWNGTGGGNSDLGDPVYSIGSGIVNFAKDIEGGWGRVLRITHNRGTMEAPILVESLYGHLDTILVKPGDTVHRGQQVGNIGNAHGIYYAHLHLEIRDSVGMPIGPGYSLKTEGYVDPTAFIEAHRPK